MCILFVSQCLERCGVLKYKPTFQKILTLFDISTDIRMCSLMYHVNPYWYMIMLSSIISPFLVYWSSHHHFQRITGLLAHVQKGNYDQSSSLNRNYFVSGIVSIYLVCLSLPIIGIILTILEVCSMYAFELIYPFLKWSKLEDCSLCRCILDIQKSLKSDGASEFFVISELFFESIPQIILQIWIYTQYADTFTNQDGVPYIKTSDIVMSLSAAMANIFMNISMLQSQAKSVGLSLSLYIPYFIGAKIDEVFEEGVPVYNWIHSNKKICDISPIKNFYVSSMVQSSISGIHRVISEHKSDDIDQIYRFDKKSLMLPGELLVDVDDEYIIKFPVSDICRFLYQCRYLSDHHGLHIRINQFTTQDKSIFNFPVRNDNKIMINSVNQQSNGCLPTDCSGQNILSHTQFAEYTTEDDDLDAHCCLIETGFTIKNVFVQSNRCLPHLLILGLYGRDKVIHRIAHYLDIITSDDFSSQDKSKYLAHKRYIKYLETILREIIRDRYNSTRLQVEMTSLRELNRICRMISYLVRDDYLDWILEKSSRAGSLTISPINTSPQVSIAIQIEFDELEYGYRMIISPSQTRHNRSISIAPGPELVEHLDISSEHYAFIHYSDSGRHRLEIRQISKDNSSMSYWRFVQTDTKNHYYIVSTCGKFYLAYLNNQLDIVYNYYNNQKMEDCLFQVLN